MLFPETLILIPGLNLFTTACPPIPWKRPTGPEAYLVPKEVRAASTTRSRPYGTKWAQVFEYVDSGTVMWTIIDVVRFAEAEKDSGPIVLLIGVKPGFLSRFPFKLSHSIFVELDESPVFGETFGAGTDGGARGVGDTTYDTLALFAPVLRSLIVEMVKGFCRRLRQPRIAFIHPSSPSLSPLASLSGNRQELYWSTMNLSSPI